LGALLNVPRKNSTSDKARSPRRLVKVAAESLLQPCLLESIPDAIVAVNREGMIMQINSQTENLFGYSREELIGQKIEVLVPERYRGLHHEHRNDFASEPKVRRMGAGLDLFGVRRDGSEFPVEISLSPVQTGEGMLVLSAIRDISDRKKIEEQLRRAHEELGRKTERQLWDYRERMAAIVDSSQDAIIGKDLQGTIISWNKGAERIYGYTAEEVLGRPITLIVPNDRPDEIPEILERIKRGEIVGFYEAVRVAKDGRRLDISLTVMPIRSNDGRIVGASAIARNITEEKRAQEQLRQAQKMEAIGRLAGGVAHDFNNILGIITSCTELLRARDHAHGGSPYIDNIRKAADRGASLTRQLLAFSRKQVVQPRILDLNERVKETSKLLRPLMGDDVQIVIDCMASGAPVEADPGQLDQIIMNLAVNARDAMPRGGKLIIETATGDFDEEFAWQHPPMTAGAYVQLAVSDTGMGMSEATIAHIFEPFFTTKETGKGTGLGLATVYGIVKQSGGHIWVYSEPGRGTTFKIYLPSAEAKFSSTASLKVEADLPKAEGKTVLLVEDDELMRALTRELLERHGYAVKEAPDGMSALQLVEANHSAIDLVLTDVVMRGMSGPELVQRLSETRPNLKFVYMSGYTGDLIAEHDVTRADVLLLEKPFSRTTLLNTLHRALAA
jgi:PAS domain S-box-containing protein